MIWVFPSYLEVVPIQNLIIAINCVIPVFISICVGYLIRKTNVVPEETYSHISTVAFYVLLPAQIIANIYGAELSDAFNPGLTAFMVIGVLLWFCAAYGSCTLLEPDRRARGAMIQSFFRTNIAVIGITMATPMMGSAGLACMSMLIAVIVPIYNILAVITLESCRGQSVDLRSTLKGIATNPLIIACVAGLLLLLSGIKLPESVESSIRSLGISGSVMTLLSLGASFQINGLMKNWRKVAFANLMKLVVGPFVFVVSALLLGFRGDDLGCVLMCTASPLAAAAFPMAIARDSDHELTGQIVVTTSFLCCFTMFLWIFLLKQLGLL